MSRDDHTLAHELATTAGRLLLDLRVRSAASDRPGAAKELRDTGDRTAHEFLVAALAEYRPDDAVLSEEGPRGNGPVGPGGGNGREGAGTSPARLRSDRVWIVDPLDGTREFAEAGRDDWAVHVALWARADDAPRDDLARGDLARRDLAPGGDLVAGAVALPAQGVTFSTADPPQLPPQGDPDARGARIVVSRTRPPAFVEQLAERLDATLVPLGSAGAKIAAVLQGKAEAYVHAGGQYEWDTAAPVAVAWAAGVHASRIDGSSLAYNREDPTLPDILVCRSSLASRLLAGIRAVADGAGDEVVVPHHDAERDSHHAP